MRTPGTILVAAALLVLAAPGRCASNDFLTFEDGSIKGESKDPQHLNWIEVSSFQFETLRAAVPSAATSRHGGSPAVHDLLISKQVDPVSSPKIQEACAAGKHFPRVTLSLRKAGGSADYLKYELRDVILSTYQRSGPTRTTETFSLSYGEIKWVYVPDTKSQEGNHSNTLQRPQFAGAAVAPASPTPAKK